MMSANAPFRTAEANFAFCCSNAKMLLFAALLSLGTFLFHVASMVIAFEGWGRSKTTLMALPPCLHLVLSLLVSHTLPCFLYWL